MTKSELAFVLGFVAAYAIPWMLYFWWPGVAIGALALAGWGTCTIVFKGSRTKFGVGPAVVLTSFMFIFHFGSMILASWFLE